MPNHHIFSAESVRNARGRALHDASGAGYNRHMADNPFQSPETLPDALQPNQATHSAGRSRVILIVRGLTILACISTAFFILMTIGWLLVEHRQGSPPQRSMVTLVAAALTGTVTIGLRVTCKRVSQPRPSDQERLL
jgi:hypothetical protein